MSDSPFMTVSELKAKLEAERDTERELTATYAKYIAAIPALCRGEEVACALHVSQPIKELRARIAELEQMVRELVGHGDTLPSQFPHLAQWMDAKCKALAMLQP